jgi:hypothetical protein
MGLHEHICAIFLIKNVTMTVLIKPVLGGMDSSLHFPVLPKNKLKQTVLILPFYLLRLSLVILFLFIQ